DGPITPSSNTLCPLLGVSHPGPASHVGQARAAGSSPRPRCPLQGLNDSEPEDFLNMIINPNKVYSPGSDSGISDEPGSDSPQPGEGAPASSPHSCPTFQRLGTREGALPQGSSHPCLMPDPRAASLAPGDWSPPLLIPDACIVNELPSAPPSAMPRPGTVPVLFPDLFLTDEEKRLLSQEGVSLPSNLPLTKVQEPVGMSVQVGASTVLSVPPSVQGACKPARGHVQVPVCAGPSKRG
uniref:Uncharacterized protein n=1 Tax=Chelonoidis abingdonii TaxID=106734 RepID=A0A8C0GAS5_CHEAB